MAHEQLNLTNDELLSTTRAVRKRLDFDRDVPMSVIKECMEIAVQAPTGSNAQGWQFMFVTDPGKRKQIGATTSKRSPSTKRCQSPSINYMQTALIRA